MNGGRDDDDEVIERLDAIAAATAATNSRIDVLQQTANRRLDAILDAMVAMVAAQRETNRRLDVLVDELAAFRGSYNTHVEHPPTPR